jgi:hypothetical protein
MLLEAFVAIYWLNNGAIIKSMKGKNGTEL